ncbi:MAG: anhydro-N-acetylmuramic acid kinase [Sulfuricella sp.]|nr:anhydro-N-acetylmuramic acid kinase [Sulfuricella sp.]
MNPPEYYVGLMSGTSLDGIDAVLATFENTTCKLLHSQFLPFNEALRTELLALNNAGANELERAALAANELSRSYAGAIQALLKQSGVQAAQVKAIGCHGQTVRHRPDLGFTLQLANPALLAELTGITVVADFRSRDIAAGGQGAPLVPAFHAALFRHPERHRAIVNIGGISNLTSLPSCGKVLGFDCGPGNLLMDAWAMRHLGQPYDRDGAWAESGDVIPELLKKLLAEPFFSATPPKSTGRDLFNLPWLERFLSPDLIPADVQTTLLELTVDGIVTALEAHCKKAGEIFLCGGGAHNGALVRRLKRRLPDRAIALTDDLGINADWVEAFAFAWLAKQTLDGKPGNLPEVTGAKSARILGAIYLA